MPVNSESGKLQTVLLAKPKYYRLLPINPTTRKFLESGDLPSVSVAVQEHAELVQAFKAHGVTVWEAEPDPDLPYGTFTRDIGVSTPKGVILGRYCIPERRGEELVAENALIEHDVPIVGHVTRGFAEGGDMLYLDAHTMVVGCGGRSNMEGIADFARICARLGIEVIPVQFHADFVHLDCVGNILNDRLAVVCRDAVPARFVDLLKERGFTLVDVPWQQVADMVCNLVALDDETMLSFPTNTLVNGQLRALGLEVVKVNMPHLLRAGGGPHCLTFVVDRA